jgi:hypothetical protein
LPELNAILQQKGVIAERGNPNSFTYKKGALLYRMLDKKGVPTGVPIKASSIAGNPTLSTLRQKFVLNKLDRALHRISLQHKLNQILVKKPPSHAYLLGQLKKENIHCILRQNTEGRMYGITFIDHNSRCVMNGSEIGKAYSMAGLNYQFAQNVKATTGNKLQIQEELQTSLVENLLAQESLHTNTPIALLKKKKKRRKL